MVIFTCNMKNCDYCLEEKATFRCGNCKTIKYCSKECQELDWCDIHQSRCSYLKRKRIALEFNPKDGNEKIGVVLFWRVQPEIINAKLFPGVDYKNQKDKDKVQDGPQNEDKKYSLIEEHNQKFSNWWPQVGQDKLKLDGKSYYTAEQWIMASKARMFLNTTPEIKGRNSVLLDKIMNFKNPSSIKKFGRKIQGFSDTLWIPLRVALQLRGLLAKFTQSENLKQELLNTKELPMAEASYLDNIFGIGKAAAPKDDLKNVNEKALDSTKWAGEKIQKPIWIGEYASGEKTYETYENTNILGVSLMAIREFVSKDTNNPKTIDDQLKVIIEETTNYWLSLEKEKRTLSNIEKKVKELRKGKSGILDIYDNIFEQYATGKLVNKQLKK